MENALNADYAFTTMVAHEADVVEQAGTTVLSAAWHALDVVSAYYRRMAEYTRGHGIAAGDAVDEVIPADRGIPGHGGPLALSG
jgi:sulfite reductase (NADPH) flavoprotein alpha-component